MATNIDTPTVFISYSWNPIHNKNRVLEIARKLISHGINVILDEWSLSEGQDKYKYMEKMVNDENVDKVLIFSNKSYMEKANNKKGGVGTESLIISDEIYTQADQTKYIPIVMEYDDSSNPCLPTFLKSRKYFDFSDDYTFATEYQKLVLSLFGKPIIKKPPLGTPPIYVTDNESTLQYEIPKLENIKASILKSQPIALVQNFYDDFLKRFESIGYIKGGGDLFDDKVIESIENWTSLRNEFIEFFSAVIESDEYFDIESFHSFLEKILKYIEKPESLTSWSGYEWDNYKFIITEFFLHIIAVLINKEKFDYLSYIIKHPYLFEDNNTGKIIPLHFPYFESYITALDDIRNKRLDLRRVSVTADLLTERANVSPINKKVIVETDLILYYLSIIHWSNRKWIPRCSVYWRYRNIAIGFLNRLVSRRYFDKVKIIFGVNTIEEFKEMLDKLASNEHEWRVSYPLEVAPIKSAFNYDELGTFD